MSPATAVPSEVEAYLVALREALDDLPTAERDDLLAEVEVSLIEAASEGESPIATRLGPPEDFAAELRAAAGLHEAARPSPREFQLARLIAWAAREPRIVALRRLLSELAPIWWVSRGYVAVGVVALLTGAAWSTAYPVVPRLGNGKLGLLAIVVAAAVSIWIGLRAPRFPRVTTVANVALLLAAVPVLARAAHAPARYTMVVVQAPPPPTVPGLAYDGVPVDNVYPFGRDGRLLHDVLLYNGSGRPIEVGVGIDDPRRRLLRTDSGTPIFNSFPIRYYEPGTTLVAHPNAAPPVKTPRIVTPPLRPRR